jgi:hypothetical protein
MDEQKEKDQTVLFQVANRQVGGSYKQFSGIAL